MIDQSKHIAVIGGGPAGLAATYELAKRDTPVICFEADNILGGISRTIEYRGFRFDVGGHRFFSKLKLINDLWREVLGDQLLTRPRLSRIYYRGKFFNYPLQPLNALRGLGMYKSLKVLTSYLHAKILPHRDERTFEQWVVNRFGYVLYDIFFKTYTEKLWGIPCQEIQAEWAAQRIKGLSLWSAVANALCKRKDNKIKTLINEFTYPRLGPGQMYETMGQKAERRGAVIRLNHRVTAVEHDGAEVTGVRAQTPDRETLTPCAQVISSMPITELIFSLRPEPPSEVLNAAKSLRYRAMLTINFLLNQPTTMPDTWIYIHDPSVKMGRVQFFANWSPHMVPDARHSSLGLEYFCWEGDELWATANDQLLALGRKEAVSLGLLSESAIMDGFVVRMPKCYPVYDSHYARHMAVIRDYLRRFNNLQCCGRYGLFKYNNMDHSILTALYAVENIFGASHDVWEVNADDEYHEAKGQTA